MPLLQSLSAKLGHVLLLYGGWGLLVMSFLDASFVPFPLVNDLALLVMASQRPARAFFYALQSTTGSVVGLYVLYALARRGRKFLWRETVPASVLRAQHWLERNDFVALLVASLLPPPAPFKVFVLTAGLLRVDAVHFVAATIIGRGLRFAAIAWLGAHYGPTAEQYLRHNLAWASLAAAALVIAAALIYRLQLRRRESPTPPAKGTPEGKG